MRPVHHVRALVLGDGVPTIAVDGETTRTSGSIRPSSRATTCRPSATRSSEIDPTHAPTRYGSADDYAARLANSTQSCGELSTIPAQNRKLVSFHDAFPYFAKHYGFELIGVILENPGQEPSAADLAALIQKVKAAGVPAVFSEAQFDPKLARTLAQEAGISRS